MYKRYKPVKKIVRKGKKIVQKVKKKQKNFLVYLNRETLFRLNLQELTRLYDDKFFLFRQQPKPNLFLLEMHGN